MKNEQSTLKIEEKKLEQTIALIKKQLVWTRKRIEKKQSEIIKDKKDMWENTSHSISNLGSSEDFEALAEMSQYANDIAGKVIDVEEMEKKIILLERSIKSPYFARIDFQFEDEEMAEQIYIGRSSLKEEGTHEMAIYDWRSPIASVFYRFVLGKAFYDAPVGKISGEVQLKRQYEIKNERLEFFFDVDVQVVDEFLRQLLSQNTSAKMKAIVETIQKEQDIVIRDMKNDLMMVQGVAGSGKTSIALHRAAYLMYEGLSSKLSANDIMIISPNALFEEYISNVLPELGETNIESMVFEEMLIRILKRKRIQSKNQFLESVITSEAYREIMKRSIEFKMSAQFLKLLNVLAAKMQYGGEKNPLVPYKRLFEDRAYFYRLAKEICLPDNIEEILVFTQENLGSHSLYYDDATALLYLKLKVKGSKEYQNIKQVVIDEAQDYYPLHYEIFHLLFPGAKFTVLGDINQTLEKQEDISLYEQIRKILDKKKSSFITMNKSFRCTNEILLYGSKFLEKNLNIESFNRKGEEPKVYIKESRKALKEEIVSEVKRCMERGYQSIGLICKTQKNAQTIFAELKDEVEVSLIKSESAEVMQGAFVIPVYMSKGLEFDAVLICDTDDENYKSEDDKKLLYVACTRALHRLNLFGEGEVSRLL